MRLCRLVDGLRSRVSVDDDVCADVRGVIVVHQLAGRSRPAQLHCAPACPSVARGPAVIGTMRSESSSASSTLFVIITVVTGRLGRRAQPGQLLLQRFARQRVERAEWLVEKQQSPARSQTHAQSRRADACRRTAGSGRRCRALPRPTLSRCRARLLALLVASANRETPRRPPDARSRAPRTTAAANSSETRSPRSAARRGPTSPPTSTLSAIRRDQAGDDLQQRGLAAAHHADNRDKFAPLDRERRRRTTPHAVAARVANALGRLRDHFDERHRSDRS